MHFTLRKTAIEQYWVIQHLLKMHSWSYQGLQNPSQPAITCSKLTIETIEQGVKYTCSSVSIVNFEQVNAGWVSFENGVSNE